MKHYKTLEQLREDLTEHKDLVVPEHDVVVDFDIPEGVMRNIECMDFKGCNFTGGNFNGWDFNGRDFNGWNFNGCNFNGRDFNGRNFTGINFNGRNFNGRNFIGMNFNGGKISYHAVFICYGSCSCVSHEARRISALPIQCLDGELTVRKEDEPSCAAKEVRDE